MLIPSNLLEGDVVLSDCVEDICTQGRSTGHIFKSIQWVSGYTFDEEYHPH